MEEKFILFPSTWHSSWYSSMSSCCCSSFPKDTSAYISIKYIKAQSYTSYCTGRSKWNCWKLPKLINAIKWMKISYHPFSWWRYKLQHHYFDVAPPNCLCKRTYTVWLISNIAVKLSNGVDNYTNLLTRK